MLGSRAKEVNSEKRRDMRPIRTLSLIAPVALVAMAFAGTSAALAETTALCTSDESPCAAGNLIGHTHLLGKVIIVTSTGTSTCDVLFLGTVQTDKLGNPLKKTGTTTYSNCTQGGSSCTVTEENGPAEYSILKEGHETASVTQEILIHVVCGVSINCSYSGVGLKGTAKGPLLSTEANGELKIAEQALTKEAGGFLCPKTSKLTLTTTSLSATYISS
jgi:hypothetical protein